MAANDTSVLKPYALQPLSPLVSGVSDFHLSLIVPIIVHWLTSGLFELCERTGFLSQYRLHTPTEEFTKNLVTRRECFRVTLQCQVLQTLLGLGLAALGEGEGDLTGNEEYDISIWVQRVRAACMASSTVLSLTGVDFKTIAATIFKSKPYIPIIGYVEFDMSLLEAQAGRLMYWYVVPIFQLVVALIVADAFMYCLHRLGHTNKWVYKHIHSQHHRLYVPYSWGASYNHPVDSIVVDGLSYAIGCWVPGLSTRLSIILFSYASFKNVTDHCGYMFPWNPMRSITGTDAGFHDVHHQSWGLKTNFGAHLSIWDRLMGTYFEDKEQISRYREKSRLATEKLTSRLKHWSK